MRVIFPGCVGGYCESPTSPRRRSGAIAELEAEGVQFEHVGDFGGFGTIEQLGDVAKEVFSREVSTEHLFLERTAGPVSEGGVFGVEHASSRKPIMA